MRPANRTGEGECYQVNQAVKAVYDDRQKQLKTLLINGQAVLPEKLYTLCLQGYHVNNAKAYLGVAEKELLTTGQHKVVTTSAQDVLEEYLRVNQNLSRRLEGRLQYV